MQSLVDTPSSSHVPSPPKPWRALLAALSALLCFACVVVWNWHLLEQRQQIEYRNRFDLNVQALKEVLAARMRAYEMVLRGLSGVFASSTSDPSYAQWVKLVKQLQVQQLYPGISSVTWSRAVGVDQLAEFEARMRTNGWPDFKVFPAGSRQSYQPIEFIDPINQRTKIVLGLDLLTQQPQDQTIAQAIDSGSATLSAPLPDLYRVSPEPQRRVGAMMYFPVYATGTPSASVLERRASFVGATNVAFRGDELVEGVFGSSRLQLFHISAVDVETGLEVFNSATVRALPPDWHPQLSGQVELPLYGRTWRLIISTTPEYEQSLFVRSHDLVLFMGLTTAVLAGLFTGVFVWQRDRQMYARERATIKLHEQAEQLILASRYKSEFLANMSHELRTPLNSILILSDQLRQNADGNLTDKQTRHADIVYRAGSDLLQLINDVLDLSKIEAGRMQISMEPLNLPDLLLELDASMRPLAEAKKLHLHITQMVPNSGVPWRVYADRVRLHQVLRNLLSNAIKFTDEGQVQLGISAGPPRADGSVPIHFAVRDTGIGIDPTQHERVFEAFQQLDGSIRRRFGGTGLGLVITRQLLQAMGGDVTLESALGQGSTFTAIVPMQPIADSVPTTYSAPQRSGRGPALLVVEDDAEFAALIVEKAHAHGFSSVHCTAGAQALDLLRQESFVAVVLDILLPDISGWQLFRRLRALPAHQRTPVHIISCLPQPAGLDAAQGIHYLTKPVERDALEQVLVSLQQGGSEGVTLLLIEDVEAEREHYRQQLQALGCVVTTCANASQARALWSRSKFDVLVVDLSLPDEDGFSLLDALDRLRPLQGVRVVVNTGLDVDARGLQHLHGYSAVVVSKQGDDTAMLRQAVQGFLGTLPPPPSPDATLAQESVPSPLRLQGQRLLLVDDDIRNVYAMTALLDEFGLDISVASDGEQAIAVFQDAPPDLILMDMSMPVMDGYTATRLLKTQYACTIPIIALTAHAMKGDREKCLEAGADDYMAKPVQREALRALLERWLSLAGVTHN